MTRRHDLVDEYRLSMYPYLAGSGTPLSEAAHPRALTLKESVGFGNGVIGLTYRRTRP